MKPSGSFVPFGILDVLSPEVAIIFGTSNETSYFICDCVELCWEQNKEKHAHIIQLVINLDNGPQLISNRTQFIRRMIEFSKKAEIEIRLVYDPPYHSKYNPIERCWRILETHGMGNS